MDAKELRRKLHSDDLIDHIDIHANVKPVLTELLDRLEAAEKDIALKEKIIDALGSKLSDVANERYALRIKIEEMKGCLPYGAIAKILTEVMDIATANGADSRSMPDEYVEVAAWLCGVPSAKGEMK